MINSLEIKNFQSHKDTRLDFDLGVNVITGETDKGKSVIIRAIRFNAENKPSGYPGDIRSWFSKKKDKTSVVIETPEIKVERRRGTTENVYIVDGDESDSLVGFGQDVPERVKEAFNLGRSCLQRQLDPVFLLADSPGEVARTLNRVVRLDEIDTLASNLNSLHNSTRKEIKFVDGDVVELEDQMKEFVDLPDIEILIEGVEKNFVVYEKVDSDLQLLQTTLEEVCGVKESLKEVREFLAVEEKYDGLMSLLDEYNEVSEELDVLLRALDEIKETREHLSEIVIVDEKKVDFILTRIEEHKELDAELSRLESIMRSIKELDQSLDSVSKKVEDLESDYSELIEEARREGLCPIVEEFGSCLHPQAGVA